MRQVECPVCGRMVGFARGSSDILVRHNEARVRNDKRTDKVRPLTYFTDKPCEGSGAMVIGRIGP